MTFTETLNTIHKNKNAIIDKYKYQYVDYGISESKYNKESLIASLSKLNGLNNQTIQLKQNVLNDCTREYNTLKVYLEQSNIAKEESEKLLKQHGQLQNDKKT